MEIKVKKGIAKPSTLTCIRSDGSSTWTKLHAGIEAHDLAHYVVETELGFTDAFYGTVAKGFDIGDFEAPRQQRPKELIPANLSLQAHQTEHIVNLLLVYIATANADSGFIATLSTILSEKDIDFPKVLDKDKLDLINTRFKDLLVKWNQLREGELLELVFDIY